MYVSQGLGAGARQSGNIRNSGRGTCCQPMNFDDNMLTMIVEKTEWQPEIKLLSGET